MEESTSCSRDKARRTKTSKGTSETVLKGNGCHFMPNLQEALKAVITETSRVWGRILHAQEREDTATAKPCVL